MLPSTERGIRRAWRRHRSVAIVARLLCVRETTVAKVVGFVRQEPPHRRERAITSLLIEEVYARRAAGESPTVIALAVGLGVARLRGVLRDLGVRIARARCGYCGRRDTTLERFYDELQCATGHGCAAARRAS